MPSRALVLAVAAAVLLVALVSGYWLWTRLQAPSSARLAAPSATRTPTDTPTPVPTVIAAPPGFRLAGVAVGEPESFAVIEAPSGSNGLYRVGEEVPDLGTLLRVDAERIVVRGPRGDFELWLGPALTATVTHTPRASATAAPTTRRRRPVRDGGTTPESAP